MKPIPKRFTAVKFVNREHSTIRFECVDDAFEDIAQFFSYMDNSKTATHCGEVSGLYDFDEVIAYIKGWKPADLSAFEDALKDDSANSQSPQP